MALKAGLLDGSSLVARPLAAPAPRRAIALVARDTSARTAEFDALAQLARDLFSSSPALRRRSRAGSAPA